MDVLEDSCLLDKAQILTVNHLNLSIHRREFEIQNTTWSDITLQHTP